MSGSRTNSREHRLATGKIVRPGAQLPHNAPRRGRVDVVQPGLARLERERVAGRDLLDADGVEQRMKHRQLVWDVRGQAVELVAPQSVRHSLSSRRVPG